MDAAVIHSCVVCEAPLSADAAVQLAYAGIYTCPVCGSGVMLPRPSAIDLAQLHSNDAYFDHPYFQVRRELSPNLAASYERRLRDLERLAGPLAGKQILDVGCDTGLFVQYAQERGGMRGTGIDVFERVVAVGRNAGLDLRHGTLDQVHFEDGSFDVVAGYDLIEHVSDPRAFVREVRRVLKPGGLAIFETPNYDGLVYRLGRLLAAVRPLERSLRAHQERLWPPFHVQYFTANSLEQLLRAGGLTPAEIRGREIAAAELALTSPPLRAGVLVLFGLAGALGKSTLLTAAAVAERTPRVQ
jgi:SAM-dependent methyltransferase